MMTRDRSHTPTPGLQAPDDLPGLIARAFAAARVAQPAWREVPHSAKAALFCRLREKIAAHGLALAKASAQPRSRPTAETLSAEVAPLAEACHFLERKGAGLLAPRRVRAGGLTRWLGARWAEVRREPYGVVLIIGPGNYPLLLPGVQTLQALFAGNTVVLKPAVGGSDAALALRDLLLECGFNPGLMTVLPETVEAARLAIAAHPDKVVFTGSVETGVKVLEELAPRIIPAAVELSGADAVIVRADADLDLTTSALLFGLELNRGATCMAPKRVFVHQTVATELEGRLAQAFVARRAEAWRLDGNSSLAQRLRPALEDALDRGAHFVAGQIEEQGGFMMPIVLAGVAAQSKIYRQDIFAPVVGLTTVSSDEEALARANDCPFALGASIFTRDEDKAAALAGRIAAGFVTINDLIVPSASGSLPFGGQKKSGFGVTRGAEGLLELTQTKVVTLSRGRFRPAFERLATEDEKLMAAFLILAHGRGFRARAKALLTVILTIASRRKP